MMIVTTLLLLSLGSVAGMPTARHPKDCCNLATHSSYNAMARISHQFAYELIAEHVNYKGPVDVALSPYSIMSVLQALSLGARGKTKVEIESHLKYSSNQHHETMKCSLDSFQQESNVTVMVASRLFADDYLMTCLNPEFAKELKYYYKSDVQGVPFTGNPRAAWEQVNTFVEEKTDGIISDFIDSWESTQLIYVNTILFKGRWKQQFNNSLTTSGSFYQSPWKQISVPMMTIEGVFRSITISKFQYYGDNLRVVELPYSDEKYNMYIFMAEKGRLGLSFMESVINQQTIPAFKKGYLQDQDRQLKIVLPKFKISSEVDISRGLLNKGVRRLFSNKADLTGIFTEFPVHFNKMIHKSVIEVTEEGTTAVGATGFGVAKFLQRTEEFIVNRPFVYVIHDSCNNMVLFQGVDIADWTWGEERRTLPSGTPYARNLSGIFHSSK